MTDEPNNLMMKQGGINTPPVTPMETQIEILRSTLIQTRHELKDVWTELYKTKEELKDVIGVTKYLATVITALAVLAMAISVVAVWQ